MYIVEFLSIFFSAIALLACGIDTDKCILFQQSDVKEHSELSWILTCLITEARLKRVIATVCWKYVFSKIC